MSDDYIPEIGDWAQSFSPDFNFDFGGLNLSDLNIPDFSFDPSYFLDGISDSGLSNTIGDIFSNTSPTDLSSYYGPQATNDVGLIGPSSISGREDNLGFVTIPKSEVEAVQGYGPGLETTVQEGTGIQDAYRSLGLGSSSGILSKIAGALGGARSGTPSGGSSLGQSARGALAAANMAALLYQALKGKNPSSPVKARASTVTASGPTQRGSVTIRTKYAQGGQVKGGLSVANRGGQDDVVDIKAAPGEYIFDAETVSHLGDGNTAAGAKKLDEMRYNIRKHKRQGALSQIAPKAKAPEQYMKGKK